MRPVNRGASGDYPADFNNLPADQQKLLRLLQNLGRATMAQQCQTMLSRLESDYKILMENQRPNKKLKTNTGAADQPEYISDGDLTTVSWLDYDSLVRLFNECQTQFQARPPKPNRNDDAEKSKMVKIYKLLKAIWLGTDKENSIKTESKKLSPLYGKARGPLINNLGQYCSYCEIPLATSLAVEHMLPKSDFPLLALVWENFLLACPLCNSYKNNKPSRATGISLSPLAGTYDPKTSPPTDQQETLIQTAARNSYLWPSDAAYTAFQNFYQYEMFKVIYDHQGNLLGRPEAIPSLQLRGWAENNQIEFNEDSRNAVTAQVKDLLAEFSETETTQIQQDLDKKRYSPLLLTQLKTNRLVLDPEFPSNVNVPDIELTERRLYSLHFTKPDKPNLDNAKAVVKVIEIRTDNAVTLPNPIRLSNDAEKKFRSLLISGLLPEQLSAQLAEPDYKINVFKDTFFIWPDNNDFFVQTEKTYLLRKDNDRFKLFNTSNIQVELHLTAVASLLSNQAKQVIKDLKLNHVDTSLLGNKETDRRMIKRTRTWFIALKSLRRIDQAINARIDLTPLLAATTETVKATGFWSVWRTVFNWIPDTSPHRNAILSILSNVNNFPGTR